VKKYLKYIGITLMGLISLVIISCFCLLLISYFFDQTPEQSRYIESPHYYSDSGDNGKQYDSERFEQSQQQVHQAYIDYQHRIQQNYTPFVMQGPPGSNLYFVSRPNGGYDQIWGPQVK